MMSDIVWEPRLLAGGALHGVRLNPVFAKACAKCELSDDERQHVVRYVWQSAKPRTWSHDWEPSALLMFSGTSLLLTGLYHRHTSASGQSLNLDDSICSVLAIERPLLYSYHQRGRESDVVANLWLQYAFSWWVRFAKAKLNQLLVPVVDV